MKGEKLHIYGINRGARGGFLHVKVSVDVSIRKIFTSMHRKYMDLRLFPLQPSRQRGHQETVEIRSQVLIVPEPKLSELRVKRPCVRGPFETLDADILKTNLGHKAPEPAELLKRRPESCERFMAQHESLPQAVLLREASIV